MGKTSFFGRTIVGCLGVLLLAALVAPSTPAGAAGTTTLAATPSTGLTDLDTVTITGTGFRPNSYVGVCEGLLSGTTLDSCGVVLFNSLSGSSGNIAFNVQLHQVMRIPSLGRTVDCRVDVCGLAAADLINDVTPDPASIVKVPISFAPAPPPPATRGTISVTPDTDLEFGTTVAVAGTGFRPDAVIELLECGSSPVDQGDCSLRQMVTADGTGAFTAQPYVITPVSPGVDCGAAPGTCTLVAGEAVDVAGTLVSHPLSFLPPNTFFGAIDVDPYVNLVDGQTVTVAGHLFDPNATVSICQSLLPIARTATCEDNVLTVTADASGELSTSYTVHPTTVVGGVAVDCRVSQCLIAAIETSASTPSVAGTAIYFRVPRPTVVPGATAAPPAEGNRGTTTVEVPVHLSEPSPLTITVPWSTLFVPGAPAGQADPGTDYVAASGVATFLPGQTDTTVSIVVNGDLLVEPDEYIVVSFNHPTNAVMGGFWGLGFGVIGNDDP